MKNLSYFAAFIFGLLILNIPLFAQERILDEAFQRAGQQGFSGVILVAEDGQILFQKAVGNRSFEDNIPLKTDDIFELASVSKQFTAMIVMMCKEKGLLGFDDPVEKYLKILFALHFGVCQIVV